MDINSPNVYHCDQHSKDGVKRCKKCDLGAYEVKSGKNGNFFGCHLWLSTGCRGSDNLSEISNLKPLPKFKSQFTSDPGEISGDRSGKKWTLQEDLLALALFDSGIDLQEIGDQLGRKPTAVQGRFARWIEMGEPRLQVQITKKSVDYENHEEEWADFERNELLSLWENKINLIEITEKLQRPKHQIIHALFESKVIEIKSQHHQIIKDYHTSK
jgi:hypothetical protein